MTTDTIFPPRPQFKRSEAERQLSDLEGPIHDLYYMSQIATQMVDDLKTDETDEFVTIRMTRFEHDLIMFALNDVVARSFLLKREFLKACKSGELA